MLLYDDEKKQKKYFKKMQKNCNIVTTSLEGAENKEKSVTKCVTISQKCYKNFVTVTNLKGHFCNKKSDEICRVQGCCYNVTKKNAKKQ